MRVNLGEGLGRACAASRCGCDTLRDGEPRASPSSMVMIGEFCGAVL